MAWLFTVLVSVATAAAAFPTPVTLVAEDGTKLAAAWGAPAKADKGVVLVHMAGRNKDDWGLFADKLYRQGLMVIALDLRGHGANVTGTPPTLLPADYAAMLQDVRAAAAHLRKAGAARVAFVGAELGANLALGAAADDPEIASVALLSPGMDYKGIIAPDAVKRYGARPILLVASQDDAYSARSATALNSLATGPHALTIFEAAGKGTRMFNREPTLEGTLVGFVNSYWVKPATAAPARQSAVPVAIPPDATKLKTSGPVDMPAPPPQ